MHSQPLYNNFYNLPVLPVRKKNVQMHQFLK